MAEMWTYRRSTIGVDDVGMISPRQWLGSKVGNLINVDG